MRQAVRLVERVLDGVVERQRASFRLGCGQCGVVPIEEGRDPPALFAL